MKRLIYKTLILVAMLAVGMNVCANDGIYFASGNTLVPVKETDISVAKEILTITMGRDHYATVDVYYEFMNHGKAKTITMAFEANPPYNTEDTKLDINAGHPYISDFTVVMNDSPLKYRNGIVALDYEESTDGPTTDFVPLDTKDWKTFEQAPNLELEMGTLYNAKLDSTISFAYAYYFDANFNPGKNVVHHTYRYRMSTSVAAEDELHYWLTPATRWQGGKIGDFTLRLKVEDGKPIVINNGVFKDHRFMAFAKKGGVYPFMTEYEENQVIAWASEDGYLEWRALNFEPQQNMFISSAEQYTEPKPYYVPCQNVVVDAQGAVVGSFIGVNGDKYLAYKKGEFNYVPQAGYNMTEFCASSGKGYITLNKKLGKEATVRIVPVEGTKVVTTLKDGGEPTELPCLGYEDCDLGNGNFQGWYKTEYKGKTGYVKVDDVLWNAF